jgi:hypothetical protein
MWISPSKICSAGKRARRGPFRPAVGPPAVKCGFWGRAGGWVGALGFEVGLAIGGLWSGGGL